ncbi:MAG: hypothetical protein GX118_03460 [Arcobacter butzleri]|jgi:cellulose biosynthesis protein BcsQ|nr:hypothetical protein [Arcobacteraceae bacterium]MDY0365577.1 cellulose synthase operon protein YhjQ/BcsQ [Arcobacteraceae bacterium]NLO17229.1 hypothetical protein [Aliarcobacter butzleri]
MTIKSYNSQAALRVAKSTLEENVKEVLELFCILAKLEYITFYKYNYEYNSYFYQFTVSNQGEVIVDEDNFKDKFETNFVVKKDGVTLGKFEISSKLQNRFVPLRKTYSKLLRDLYKLYEIEKELYGSQTMFNVHIVYDKTQEAFAQNLQSGLRGLFNIDIFLETSLSSKLLVLKNKDIKHIVIYVVDGETNLVKDTELIKQLNELIIAIGPDDHRLSMLCGKLGIETYISRDDYKLENLKPIVLQTRKNLINKDKTSNKIISIAGISGGIGTTTVAMNAANLLSKNAFDKNILFIDLSTTKAVSNMFLEKNPVPDTTIIELINSGEFDLVKNLDNGLVKIRENLYTITGIQKQTDKDILEKDTFIGKLLDYIKFASEHFNYIIIDIGTADSSYLKTTMYDLANEFWLITEMTLPHISKLKTFYNLLKRAGLKDKTSFLINRYDSQSAISIDDVLSILNMEEEDKIFFDYKLRNDYRTLGSSWNYCELASEIATSKDSFFIASLEDVLMKKHFYIKSKEEEKAINNLLSTLLKKGKK